MKKQAQSILPTSFVSEEDKDKAQMKAISVVFGILGGGAFVALVVFEPGIIIWAAQTGGKAIAIAVMVLSIIIPIAYKYDQKVTADPEEDYKGYEMTLDKLSILEIIHHPRYTDEEKIKWLKLAGAAFKFDDGKFILEDQQKAYATNLEKEEKNGSKEWAVKNNPVEKRDALKPKRVKKKEVLEPGAKSKLEINQ